MIDITGQVSGAAEQAADWSAERGLAALEKVAERNLGQIEWDSGAGEDWAAFLVEDGLTTIVHLALPLAVTSEPGHVEVLRDAGVHEVVVVPDFAEGTLRCDASALGRAFFDDGDGWRADLDPEGISARDLWAMTV